MPGPTRGAYGRPLREAPPRCPRQAILRRPAEPPRHPRGAHGVSTWSPRGVAVAAVARTRPYLTSLRWGGSGSKSKGIGTICDGGHDS